MSLEDERGVYREIVLAALSEVEKFIAERKRLLVGGMMIDLALKKKGDRLYPDDELPDYDFVSPDFHRDAYDIGKRLHALGMPNVDCINGMHSATMRVRVNFMPVADITYVPQNIYDKIPFIPSGRLRLVHPHFQMMDQHSAMNRPFSHGNVGFRWKKDMERFDMLYTHYPVEGKAKTKPTPFSLDTGILEGQCLGGFVGLLYLQKKAEALGFKPKYSGSIKITDKSISGESHGVTIHSDDLWELMEKFEGTRVWYNEYLEKLPRSMMVGSVEILDNHGRQIGASQHGNFWVAGTPGLCLYFLASYMKTGDGKFAEGFMRTVELVTWAAKHQKIGGIFLPLATVYGKEDISDLFVFNIRRMAVMFGDIPRTSFTPKPMFFRDMNDVPPNYYQFDPTTSDIYGYDGKKTAPFKPMELPPVKWQ